MGCDLGFVLELGFNSSYSGLVWRGVHVGASGARAEPSAGLGDGARAGAVGGFWDGV